MGEVLGDRVAGGRAVGDAVGDAELGDAVVVVVDALVGYGVVCDSETETS